MDAWCKSIPSNWERLGGRRKTVVYFSRRTGHDAGN